MKKLIKKLNQNFKAKKIATCCNIEIKELKPESNSSKK